MLFVVQQTAYEIIFNPDPAEFYLCTIIYFSNKETLHFSKLVYH